MWTDIRRIHLLTRPFVCCPLSAQGLFSSVICPGLVMTNLTYGILPSFLWSLIMPVMYLVRRQHGCRLSNLPGGCDPEVCVSLTDQTLHQHIHPDAV